MSSELADWFLGVVVSSGLVAAVGYLARETIASSISRIVSHKLEKQMEEYKSDIRERETQLNEITSFLSSSRKEINSALQDKRINAAEELMKLRRHLSKYSMLASYMQLIKEDEALKHGNDKNFIEFINTITAPFDMDGFSKNYPTAQRDSASLYLSNKTMEAFGIYESIITRSLIMMKFFSVSLDGKDKYINQSNLSERITKFVPSSAEGFDNLGEGFVYSWSEYFHEQILFLLRQEVSGLAVAESARTSIEEIMLESRRAHSRIRASLKQAGVPEEILEPEGSLTNRG